MDTPTAQTAQTTQTAQAAHARLTQAREKLARLEKELAESQKTVAELEEILQMEDTIARATQRLAELNEPREQRAVRDAQARQKEKVDAIKREAEQRIEESRRPAHWPLPRPNMSKAEEDDWWEAHFP